MFPKSADGMWHYLVSWRLEKGYDTRKTYGHAIVRRAGVLDLGGLTCKELAVRGMPGDYTVEEANQTVFEIQISAVSILAAP